MDEVRIRLTVLQGIVAMSNWLRWHEQLASLDERHDNEASFALLFRHSIVATDNVVVLLTTTLRFIVLFNSPDSKVPTVLLYTLREHTLSK